DGRRFRGARPGTDGASRSLDGRDAPPDDTDHADDHVVSRRAAPRISAAARGNPVHRLLHDPPGAGGAAGGGGGGVAVVSPVRAREAAARRAGARGGGGDGG